LRRANRRIEEGGRIMSKTLGRLRLVALGLGVLTAGSVVEASVLSLKAVKRSKCVGGTNINLNCASNIGTNNLGDCPGSTCQLLPITAINTLTVLGNQTIEAEISLNSWALDFPLPTTGVHTYNVTINAAGYIPPGSGNGNLAPLGWCRPLTAIPCITSADCSAYPAWPTCDLNPITGCRCATGHNPDLGGFITSTRSDFLFFGMDPIRGVDTISLGFRYFAVPGVDTPVVLYNNVAKYLGTLILKVSANACGTFTVNFANSIDETFITDNGQPPVKSLPTLQPLTLVVSDCARQLLSCSPDHCNVDARIAADPKTCGRLNPTTIEMTFSKTTAGMTSANFEMTVLPIVDGDAIPVIQSVTQDLVNPNKTKLVVGPRIPQTRWTCFRDIGSNKRCCMGSLPGDSNGTINNWISNENDIFESLDNLLGGVNPILAMEKCDTDRSLLCSSADLLMIVDLLNGADCLGPRTLNQTLPALVPTCPDMRLPP